MSPHHPAADPEQKAPERLFRHVPVDRPEKPIRRRRPHRRLLRPYDSPDSYMRSFLWKVLALLTLFTSVLTVILLVQRGLWLFRDFRPLRLPYERELVYGYHGLMMCSDLLSLLTAFSLWALLLKRRGRRERFLRVMLAVRRVTSHMAAWGCAAAAAGLCWLIMYYRLSVQLLGVVGAVGAALFVLFLFQARFFRHCGKAMRDMGMCIRLNRFPDDKGFRGMLMLCAMVTALFQLIPVAVVLAEGILAETLAAGLPWLNIRGLMASLGTGATGAQAMYTVDGMRCVCQGCATLMAIPLYRVYRASRS